MRRSLGAKIWFRLEAHSFIPLRGAACQAGGCGELFQEAGQLKDERIEFPDETVDHGSQEGIAFQALKVKRVAKGLTDEADEGELSAPVAFPKRVNCVEFP